MSCYKDDGKNHLYLKPLRYWCHKVLPLVYDDSLSYYEVLCKVSEKINEIVELFDPFTSEFAEYVKKVDDLEAEMEALKNGDYTEIIEKYIAEAIKMVFFGLTDSGYFIAYIPDSWADITFNTTEYDLFIPTFTDYGHLTLSY